MSDTGPDLVRVTLGASAPHPRGPAIDPEGLPVTATTPPAPTRRARRLAAVLLGASVLAVGLAGPASAKEIGSGGGGGGGGTAACNPVANLTVKTDATTSDTAVGSIQASYSVKPCSNGQILTVETKVNEFYDPSVVVYDDPAAVLNGKFSVFGIRSRVLYTVSVTAFDAATGAQAGRLATTVAAVPKGV